MKTVVLLPNWLGDAMMAVPALQVLRADGPVVGFGMPALTELLQGFGLLDHQIDYDRRGVHSGARGLLRAMGRLRREHADRVVCFSPSERSAALVWGSGAPLRWSSVRPGIARWASTRSVSGLPDPSRHLSDRWLDLVGGAPGAGTAVPWPTPLVVPTEWDARARELLSAHGLVGEPFAVFAPTATFGPTKEWPAESYIQLGRRMQADGPRIVVVGGGSPSEKARAEEVASGVEGISLAGETSLPQLAALVRRAAIFVGNDSGPMHLSAALGTPTIGIFTSTSPGWTAPRGLRAMAVGGPDLPCAPCFSAQCSQNFECMDAVRVVDVEEAWRRLVAPAEAPVVWLDRDGTLLDDPGYLSDPAGVVVWPGAASGVARLNAAGVRVVMVTNQSGIGRGLMTRQQVDAVHAEVLRRLAGEGAHLDHIVLCPHAPEQNCSCRKPEPGMILHAREILAVSGRARQFVVGDKPADVELARRVGVTSVLVRTGDGRATEAELGGTPSEADRVVDDLSAAADWILAELDSDVASRSAR